MDMDAPMTDRVNLREELEAVGIEEILTQLDSELIGLKPVKTRIREIASLLLIERIRKRKMTTSGKRNKRERRRLGTPAFPVHIAGYDAKAADAPRKTEK